MMTPHRDTRSKAGEKDRATTGTFVLDRIFRGVGRVKLASGTSHAPTFRNVNAMLSGLFARGRLDLLCAIRDRTLTPLQVWSAYRLNELERLPTAPMMLPLVPAFLAWADRHECSDEHRRSLKKSSRYFASSARKDAVVADLPAVLRDLSDTLGRAHPRSFNLARAAALAFVHATLKRHHPLWTELASEDPLRVTPQRRKAPQSVADLLALVQRMGNRGPMAWSMAVTGMGPGEYWGRWRVEPDRVRIHGTKRAGRDRFVPLLGSAELVRPTCQLKAFRTSLRSAGDGQVTVYDLRRTYANWLEQAGVPRTRRRLYLGHGATDVTDLYEWHDVARFLAEDAEKLREFLAQSHGLSHGRRVHA
ncbi:MAG: hypothetical protein ACR2OG_08400 [Gemmatimonadaceae bacterium]